MMNKAETNNCRRLWCTTSEKDCPKCGMYPCGLRQLMEQAALAIDLQTQLDALKQERQWVPERCEICKDGKIVLHIPEFRALAIANQHMNRPAFDLELKAKFCPGCGQPLPDTARKAGHA